MNSIAFLAYTDRFNFLQRHLGYCRGILLPPGRRDRPVPGPRPERDRAPDRDRPLDAEVQTRLPREVPGAPTRERVSAPT